MAPQRAKIEPQRAQQKQQLHEPVMHERLFNYLFAGETTTRSEDIPEQAREHQSRNFFLQVFALSLTKTGDQFMDPKITLSWLLSVLSVPTAFLSLLVPVHNTFSLLPQMLVAYLVRKAAIRKWFWFAGALGQSLALLLMCLVALNLSGATAGVGIVSCLLFFSLARGICSVAQKDVLGKTVARTRRGRVSGYTESIAGVLTLLLACWMIITGTRTLDVVVGILAFAAGLWIIAALAFGQIDEAPSDTLEGSGAISGIAGQLSLLRVNKEFRKFLLVRSALLGSALAAPYLVVLVQSNVGSDLYVLGGLLLAASLASFVSGSTWGRLADRSSARCMAVAGTLAGFAGLLAVVFVSAGLFSLPVLAACLFLLYLAHAGVRVGRKTHLVDMASAEDRSAMVAVSNSLIGVMLLVFAGIGVLISEWHLYAGLIFFSVLALTGALLSLSLQEVQSPALQADNEA